LHVVADGAPRLWHDEIGRVASGAGTRASVSGEGPGSAPAASVLLADRLAPSALDRPAPGQAAAPADPALRRLWTGPAAVGASPDDLVIRIDGKPALPGARSAALAGLPPEIVVATVAGHVLARGRPALERPHLYGPSLDSILARAADLAGSALRTGGGSCSPADLSPSLPATGRWPAGHLLRRFAVPVGHRFRRAIRRRPDWRVGWRAGAGTMPEHGPAGGEWNWLPQGRERFFADPFPFVHEGVLHCFVEDLPHATGKGVIAHFTVGPDGRPDTPRTVLQRPCHLSYPFVFAHDGAIWMIPETSTAGTIELYRAERFPDRWTLDRVLAEGGAWSDATLAEHGGRWWLFATEAGPFRSTWDTLVLFHGPSPLGPFEPHAANPVLIDAGGARPAGPLFRHGDSLVRPFQDCRAGYGAGLGFARIDRLDADGFAQTVLARHPPPPGWRALGMHHLATAGGFEFVDRLSVD
jgi:hypothetical protein